MALPLPFCYRECYVMIHEDDDVVDDDDDDDDDDMLCMKMWCGVVWCCKLRSQLRTGQDGGVCVCY